MPSPNQFCVSLTSGSKAQGGEELAVVMLASDKSDLGNAWSPASSSRSTKPWFRSGNTETLKSRLRNQGTGQEDTMIADKSIVPDGKDTFTDDEWATATERVRATRDRVLAEYPEAADAADRVYGAIASRVHTLAAIRKARGRRPPSVVAVGRL